MVSPLRSAAAGSSFPTFAALVLVCDPDPVTALDAEILRAMYGMARAEAATATGLASGKTPAEIACDTGTSVETVRTHVKRAMSKTETRRQAELIAVVLHSPAFKPDQAKG
jgi:DNA-binding CsgD family transcriptional regulator